MKRTVVKLVSLLALMVGLPFLGLKVLQTLQFQQTMMDLAQIMGREPAAREIRQLWLFSPLPLPALWCSLSAAGAAVDAPKTVRVIAWSLVAFSALWLAIVLVRVAIA